LRVNNLKKVKFFLQNKQTECFGEIESLLVTDRNVGIETKEFEYEIASSSPRSSSTPVTFSSSLL
jgi:hypothetical protein